MSSELVHEIDVEKESTIQLLKSKLLAHPASAVNTASDSLELATQFASNLDADKSNRASVVSDDVLVKSNTVPYIYANDNIPNAFGDSFVELPTSNSEKFYQIKLLSAPDRRRTYIGTERESQNTEVVTVMMLVLLVVIVAIILHLVIRESEQSMTPNEQNVYLIMAHKNNSDPDLGRLRYMPVSEQERCVIM